MRVYLAARFSRLPELVGYASELEASGRVTVTSRWIRGGHEWVGTDDDAIPIDDLARFAREDLDDIEAADLIVCFTESPRSGPARGGRHVEMGYALARGIPILTVGHRENVFYCLPEVRFSPSWEMARRMIVAMAGAARPRAGSMPNGTRMSLAEFIRFRGGPVRVGEIDDLISGRVSPDEFLAAGRPVPAKPDMRQPIDRSPPGRA